MNNGLHPGLLEATRLTREGRLAEAMAMLQQAFQGGTAAYQPPGTTGDAGDSPHGRAPQIIDVVPETITVTDPLPSRRTKPAFGTGSNHPAGKAEGTAPPLVPEALRDFIEKVTRTGLEPGIGGLAKSFPARAPDPVPDGAQFVTKSYANQAGSREYKLYVPSGYSGQPLPLVVMLHGCTQSPDDFAAGTRMNALAEEHTCLVAYPAQAASANMQKCWNWFSPNDQRRDQGEPSLIAGITRQIMQDYPVDPQRVYVAGLSAGAAAAVIMGTAYPELYAALGVHSGLACGSAGDIASAFAAMQQGKPGATPAGAAAARRSVPTIVFHGDRDTTVNPSNGDHVIAQLKAAAPQKVQANVVETGQVPGGHRYTRTLHGDPHGRTVFEQWVIHGAGHAWSGGSSAGSYTDPKGPDATREMMRFFLDHPHPTAARRA
jgi:poly(hydroxyalkanoate) depolymerase family esterase